MVGMESVPMCCGAMFFHSFSNLLNDARKLERALHNSLNAARAASRGLVFCVLNNRQVEQGAHKVFEKMGFELVFKTTNPVHSDRTTLHLMACNLSNTNHEKQDLKYQKKERSSSV